MARAVVRVIDKEVILFFEGRYVEVNVRQLAARVRM